MSNRLQEIADGPSRGGGVSGLGPTFVDTAETMIHAALASPAFWLALVMLFVLQWLAGRLIARIRARRELDQELMLTETLDDEEEAALAERLARLRHLRSASGPMGETRRA